MRNVITATDGHVLTNGDIYGKVIYLAEGMDGADFHEITLDEYNSLMEAEASREDDKASAEDYMNALKELGVRI